MENIIYPFFNKNGKLLVTSASNILKTQFVLQMCIDLLNPEESKFLEVFKTNHDNCPQNILFVNGNFTAFSLSCKINRILLGFNDVVKENILSHLFILNTKDQSANEVFKLIDESVKQNNIDIVVIDGLKNTDSRTMELNVDVLAVEYKIPLIITKLVENDANYVNWMYRDKNKDDYADDIVFIENCDSYLNHIIPFINHLRSFISAQTHKKLSECTCNRLCGYLRSIFRFGFFSELLEKNPMQRWRHPKEPPRRFTVDLNDITKVMSVSAPHVKNAIECSFNLGTRISELLALKWENVNFEQATVRIYATKTRTYREVPVKPDFLEKLRKMKEDAKSEYVIEFRGKRVGSIRMAFVRAVKRSGIGKDFRIHDLRHIYATYMLSNGADLAAVSRMLGHSTVVLTANTYLQYQKGAKEQAIALLPDLPLK